MTNGTFDSLAAARLGRNASTSARRALGPSRAPLVEHKHEHRAHAQNGLLARLSQHDLLVLFKRLERIEMPVRLQLARQHRRTDFVYLMESGLASAVIRAGMDTLEVGLIGNEGMTGISALHGVDCAAYDIFVGISGTGWRISAEELARFLADSQEANRIFLHYAHTFMMQMSYAALSAARQQTANRLARWLLMADDRVHGTSLAVTHESLAWMLATRRPGVTAALSLLKSLGAIKVQRRQIYVLDREQLKDLAGEAYGAPEEEYLRLLGRRSPGLAEAVA